MTEKSPTFVGMTKYMGTFDAIIKGAEFLRKADKIEEYKKILELLEERPKFFEQISELKEENRQLKEKLKNKEEVKKGINCYIGQDGTYYCMRCLDKNQELIRLTLRPGRMHMICPECKNSFNVTGQDKVAEQFNLKFNDMNKNSAK
jgi:hypothetical protein